MKPTEVLSYRARLKNVIALAKATADEEVRAHLAAYVCVLLCGFVEAATRSVLMRYAESKSAPRIRRYTEHNLGFFYNPTMNRLNELLTCFDPQWAEKLQALTADEVRDGVNSIVANKNNIVHGKSVGITLVRAERYYKSAEALILSLEELCV